MGTWATTKPDRDSAPFQKKARPRAWKRKFIPRVREQQWNAKARTKGRNERKKSGNNNNIKSAKKARRKRGNIRGTYQEWPSFFRRRVRSD